MSVLSYAPLLALRSVRSTSVPLLLLIGPCLVAADTFVFRSTLEKLPSPKSDLTAAVDAYVWERRMAGTDESVVLQDRKNVESALREEHGGYTRKGIVKICYTDEGVCVTSFGAILGQPPSTSSYVQLYRDGISVFAFEASRIVEVRSGNVLTRLQSAGERLFLLGALPTGARSVRSDEKGEVFQYARQGHLEELAIDVERDRGVVSGRSSFVTASGDRILFNLYERLGNQVVIQRVNRSGRMLYSETYALDERRVDALPSIPSLFDAGDSVADYRLEPDKPISYRWTGSLPSLDELRDLRNGAQVLPESKTDAILYTIGLLLLVAGLVVKTSRSWRSRTSVDPS